MSPHEVYIEARFHAGDYSTAMGDPMYALSSSGAIVYGTSPNLLGNLIVDAEEARAQGDDDAADAFGSLAAIITDAINGTAVRPDEDDEGAWVDFGYEVSAALRGQGIPVGPPTVERGWSRGPRYVLPAVASPQEAP